MSTVLKTSLEALLLKATQSSDVLDDAAVDAFCTLICREKDGAHMGAQVLASRLVQISGSQLLQLIDLLNHCMSRCGSVFQSEIGKFRFLNELVKLVSPKYMGNQTADTVKQRILELLHLWTLDYPRENKIKEAYDILCKQVVDNTSTAGSVKNTNSIQCDEEKSRILQKLLQSKSPEDIQTANWLIKSLVNEDDKKAEVKSKHLTILESVQNNVKLLNEMLDSYNMESSSTDDLDLIHELKQSCERMKPNVIKLVSETQQNDGIVCDALNVCDNIDEIFTKFDRIIISNDNHQNANSSNNHLLDLMNPTTESPLSKILLVNQASAIQTTSSQMANICDIFSATDTISDSNQILKPTLNSTEQDEPVVKPKSAFHELNVLSDQLLKDNLQSSSSSVLNISLNSTDHKQKYQSTSVKSDEQAQNGALNAKSDSIDFDVNSLLDIVNSKTVSNNVTNSSNEPNQSDDIQLLNIYDHVQKNEFPSDPIDFSAIRPSSFPAINVLNCESTNLNITLCAAKDKPQPNVYVFVLTTTSRNEHQISNYQIQVDIAKDCKVKLQKPSNEILSAFTPFLPPSAITQIMLIFNPSHVPMSLELIASFQINSEIYTRKGHVENLPMV